MQRRDFLRTVAAAGAAGAVPLLARCADPPPTWDRDAYAKPAASRVALLAAADYGPGLAGTVRDGLRLVGADVRGRRVVLKPNLVEFDPDGAINTHPALIAAAVEAFRSLGAAAVTVAEGPGHRRDNDYLLAASGLDDALTEAGARYVDLNLDPTRPVRARSDFTSLGRLHLPATVLDADLFVSMPKLKTHHWAGVTLSMKNLFGIMPGGVYGWPKNVLHWAGIDGSIVDINAALRVPRLAIVDAIVGMEGNGPIQGTPRRTGALLFGADPVAVDATAARLMMIDPEKVPSIANAGRFLGNLEEERITHIGEDPGRFAQDYAVLDRFRHLKAAPLASAG